MLTVVSVVVWWEKHTKDQMLQAIGHCGWCRVQCAGAVVSTVSLTDRKNKNFEYLGPVLVRLHREMISDLGFRCAEEAAGV